VKITFYEAVAWRETLALANFEEVTPSANLFKIWAENRIKG
jgi:hypothetical protein